MLVVLLACWLAIAWACHGMLAMRSWGCHGRGMPAMPWHTCGSSVGLSRHVNGRVETWLVATFLGVLPPSQHVCTHKPPACMVHKRSQALCTHRPPACRVAGHAHSSTSHAQGQAPWQQHGPRHGPSQFKLSTKASRGPLLVPWPYLAYFIIILFILSLLLFMGPIRVSTLYTYK
ncbi:hypothetical protein I3843_15G089600 [Carya illinoinensis]|nr:hypothetical protein I3843_15G089600 [Carya illinoinensis]